MDLSKDSRRQMKQKPQSSGRKDDDLSASGRGEDISLREALNFFHFLMDSIQDEKKDLKTKVAHILDMNDKLKENMTKLKKKRYIDEDIVYQIEIKVNDMINYAGDLLIRSGTPGLDVSGELAKLRNLTIGIRSCLTDVGLLLEYFQDREVTRHEDISVLTLLDEPRFSVFLLKTEKRKLLQKRVSVKCEENCNMDNIFKESKLCLSTLQDDCYTVQSDVFQINQFNLSTNAHCKVELFKSENCASEEWAAIIRKNGKWIEHPVVEKKHHAYLYAQDIDIVYIVSRPKRITHTLTRKGWTFQSDEDPKIKVVFPAGAVEHDTPLSLKVMTEQVGYMKGQEEEDDFEVYAVSPCVSVDHKGVAKFKKNVKVFLPFPDISFPSDTFLILLHWKDDDEMELHGQNIEIKHGVGVVEVDSFSKYVYAGVKRGPIQNFPSHKKKVSRQIIHRFGKKINCQILIFVDTSENNTLWVEAVSSKKMEEVLSKRRKDNPDLLEMNNSRSREVSLMDRQIIRISVEGKSNLNTSYKDGHVVLPFRRNSTKNHTRFPLEPNPSRCNDEFTHIIFQTNTKENSEETRLLHRYHFSKLNVKKEESKSQIAEQTTARADKTSNLLEDEDFFSERSLRVLAEYIPVKHTESLGIQLGIRTNDIADFKAKMNTGIDLNFKILQEWILSKGSIPGGTKYMDLSNALLELKLTSIYSIVQTAFKEKRELQRGDFPR